MGQLTIPQVSSDLTLIARQTVTSGTTMTFSSIPQTFKHLKFIGLVRSGSNCSITLSFTVTIFASGYHHWNSSSSVAGGTATGYLGDIQANTGCAVEFSLPDYTSASQTKGYVATLGGVGPNAGYGISGGGTTATGAISTVTLTTGATISNFVGSLWGYN